MKEDKYGEVIAQPTITLMDRIEIQGKDTPIVIGGWNIEGFYLEEPYILKEEKGKDFSGNYRTYYKIVKNKNLQSKREKQIREFQEKKKEEDKKYYEKSIEDAKKLIKGYTEKLKELEK